MRRGGGKKAKAKLEPEAEDTTPPPPPTRDTKEELFPVDWTPELSLSMLTIILEDREIKMGLYPGAGQHASTKNGGGKPKTDHQFAIAEALWKHESFWPQGKAMTTKVRTQICNKIKNRLSKMEKEVRIINEKMGQTGQGMTSKDEIDVSLDNQLTRTWKEVEKTCPWYFEMKGLVAERPSRNPVGLGNSESGIDLSALDAAEDLYTETKTPDVDDDQTSLSGLIDVDDNATKTSSDWGLGDPMMNVDDESPPPPSEVSKTQIPSKRKPAASKSSSLPESQLPPTKKFKISNEFSQISETMQHTRQKALDLAMEKERSKGKELELRTKLKMEKMRQKALRDERRHERKLKKMQNEAQMMSATSMVGSMPNMNPQIVSCNFLLG
ncbi:hypothetical protein FB446DRAFT_775574 [Lentinula raphanica]|nr:hypothetical protein FB446DRAFT_775574 [Lentinula raphanica]